MKKILFACILMIGTSNVSVADEYLKSIYNECVNGDMNSCDTGIRKSCVILSDYYDKNYKACRIFELEKGINLYQKGDYVGSKEFIERAIHHGSISAQKAMAILCSNQPWVCRGNGLL